VSTAALYAGAGAGAGAAIWYAMNKKDKAEGMDKSNQPTSALTQKVEKNVPTENKAQKEQLKQLENQ